MVKLNSESTIDQKHYPFSYSWDSNVRRHYKTYQDSIDRYTFHLQRTQRYLFSLAYPYFYSNDITRLRLLKQKQGLGEVFQHQIDQYKVLYDQDIATHFNKSFSGKLPLSQVATGTGFALLGLTTFFNVAIVLRVASFVIPVAAGYLHNTNNIASDLHTSEFLNWVTEVRKKTAFAEISKDKIEGLVPKYLEGKNLLSLFESYVKLTTSQ